MLGRFQLCPLCRVGPESRWARPPAPLGGEAAAANSLGLLDSAGQGGSRGGEPEQRRRAVSRHQHLPTPGHPHPNRQQGRVPPQHPRGGRSALKHCTLGRRGAEPARPAGRTLRVPGVTGPRSTWSGGPSAQHHTRRPAQSRRDARSSGRRWKGGPPAPPGHTRPLPSSPWLLPPMAVPPLGSVSSPTKREKAGALLPHPHSHSPPTTTLSPALEGTRHPTVWVRKLTPRPCRQRLT